MLQIQSHQIEQVLNYPALIHTLRTAFQANYTVPQRHHHDFNNPFAQKASTLLLMPAWDEGQYFGVKLATVSPENSQLNLPAINGVYLLFDTQTGAPIAQIEAKTLTTYRTAAASALAATYLAAPNSQTLLMMGTGAMAPQLIRAHAAVRPIERVFVWGRRKEKAMALVQTLSKQYPWTLEVVDDLAQAIPQADIISCATLSETPILQGKYLRPGQHIDLVGSYKPNMREADDALVQKARVFLDTREGASRESGDIALPLQSGLLTTDDLLADLFDLCRGKHPGRQRERDITLFKSVGHALEDLAAAKLVYSRINHSEL
ncbi:MAG: ornithine cyclodeaminase family protein [Bacteroidota bacterium]